MAYKLTISYRLRGKCSVCKRRCVVTSDDLEDCKQLNKQFKDGKFICSRCKDE